jgi:hypothetical protein
MKVVIRSKDKSYSEVLEFDHAPTAGETLRVVTGEGEKAWLVISVQHVHDGTGDYFEASVN